MNEQRAYKWRRFWWPVIVAWRRATGNWWVVRRTNWPYKNGWGIYNPSKRTALETGLESRELAQRMCDFQNAWDKPQTPAEMMRAVNDSTCAEDHQ